MGKRTYKVTNQYDFELVIEIDHTKVTENQLHEMNNFFSNANARLKESNNNIVNVCITKIAGVAWWLNISKGYNTYGVVEEFNPNNWNQGIEGYPAMDGTSGFRIISSYAPELNNIEDMEIQLIQEKES